ncbi:hypothetical protein CPB85DRAFT_1255342 [Mucidula mucida]|nr:hypothetical protein CPB85DRAFT_1255342 [Mucidula mucida]
MLNTSRHRFALSRVNGYLFSVPVLAVTGTCYAALLVASGFGGGARILWMWFHGKRDWIAQCMHQRSDCEEQWVLLGAPLAAQAFMLLQVLAAACVILGGPAYMCVVFVERVNTRSEEPRGFRTRNGHAYRGNGSIQANGKANGHANNQ